MALVLTLPLYIPSLITAFTHPPILTVVCFLAFIFLISSHAFFLSENTYFRNLLCNGIFSQRWKIKQSFLNMARDRSPWKRKEWTFHMASCFQIPGLPLVCLDYTGQVHFRDKRGFLSCTCSFFCSRCCPL